MTIWASIFKNRKNFFNNIPNIIQNSKTIYGNKIQNQSLYYRYRQGWAK